VPIRPDLRPFYGRTWYEVTRPRILRRAGGRFRRDGTYLGGAKCERCQKPDRQHVFTFKDRLVLAPDDVRPFMFWLAAKGDGVWRDQFGQLFPGLKLKTMTRKVWVVLQVGHVNHIAGDDRDENLRAWCPWCHLHHDAVHHRESRSMRKDVDRPLLRGIQFPAPSRADYSSEIDFCLAMQRWSIQDGDGPQRSISINDWIAEEVLLRCMEPEVYKGAAVNLDDVPWEAEAV
jgi:hypothetical protein